MTHAILAPRPAIAMALALSVAGCAGGEMSRFADTEGAFSTSEGESGGGNEDPDPSTDPAESDGTESSATTMPTTTSPSTTASEESADESSTGADDESSTGAEETTDSAEESSGSPTTDEGSSSEESSESGETAVEEDVDLSGYTIVQTASDREFVLPEGTLVPRGGSLVIARNASPGAFQDFWGVNWGDEVVYIDGADTFPTINGDETYVLLAPDGTTVIEGPTPALELSTVSARTDASADAGDESAWSVDIAPNSGSTPGSSTASGGVSGTPYISEYSDPTGAGNFVYEYVEISVVP